MNLGTAIKIVRKKKNISQKELANKCGISINALSQIELNESFPQKGTIQKICTELEIPPSYLLFLSISEDDVPEDKKKMFNLLSIPLRQLLLED